MPDEATARMPTTPRDLLVRALDNINIARFKSATFNIEDALSMIDALTAERDDLRLKSKTFGTQCPSCSSRGISALEWERTRIVKARGILTRIEKHSNVSDQTWELLAQLRTVLGS